MAAKAKMLGRCIPTHDIQKLIAVILLLLSAVKSPFSLRSTRNHAAIGIKLLQLSNVNLFFFFWRLSFHHLCNNFSVNFLQKACLNTKA